MVGPWIAQKLKTKNHLWPRGLVHVLIREVQEVLRMPRFSAVARSNNLARKRADGGCNGEPSKAIFRPIRLMAKILHNPK